MAETIALVRSGSGLDFNRYVDRTFKTYDAAGRYLNKTIRRNCSLMILDGKYKVGDVVPMGTGKVF